MIKAIEIEKLFKEAKIAVLGDVMLDRYFSGDAERISPEAPIPVVDVNNVWHIPGGAANVMSNLASLGAKVWGFGVTGSDAEGKLLKDILVQRNIDVVNITADIHRPTTVKCRVIVGHHQMLRYDFESREHLPNHIASKLIKGLEQIATEIDMLVISDYDKGVMSHEAISSILEIARNHKIEVLVDPKVNSTRSYVSVEYLKINISNAKKVTGMDFVTPSKATKQICQTLAKITRCNNLIMTMGKEGLLVFSEGKMTRIPTLAKDVYDVTGAGDVMTAVLSLALINGYDITTACEIATIAASLKVTKIGTYSISREELISEIKIRASSMSCVP